MRHPVQPGPLAESSFQGAPGQRARAFEPAEVVPSQPTQSPSGPAAEGSASKTLVPGSSLSALPPDAQGPWIG